MTDLPPPPRSRSVLGLALLVVLAWTAFGIWFITSRSRPAPPVAATLAAPSRPAPAPAAMPATPREIVEAKVKLLGDERVAAIKAEREKERLYAAARPPGLTAVAAITQLKDNPNYRSNILFYGPDGRLSAQAIAAVNLTPDETARVQACCDQHYADMRALLRTKVVPMPHLQVGDVRAAYRIPPYAGDGERIFGGFLDQLTAIVGADRAWTLAKSIRVYEDGGGYGQYDTIVRFIDMTTISSPAKSRGVEVESRDAVTGQHTTIRRNPDVTRADRNFFNFLQTL